LKKKESKANAKEAGKEGGAAPKGGKPQAKEKAAPVAASTNMTYNTIPNELS